MFLALITLIAYLPVTRHTFLNLDDDLYITHNRIVQSGLTLAGAQWAFATWHASNWHPVAWLSHMLDCELFRLDPGAHHCVNVLLHTANALLLLALLCRLTGQLWPSIVVAALFAWHPLCVEPAAWIAKRKDVLSTFFGLLTLLAYASYAGKRSPLQNQLRSSCFRFGCLAYSLALLFFALGLMSKPMMVTLPFVMLLLDYWPLNTPAPYVTYPPSRVTTSSPAQPDS